jgi:hypothetical protein
LIRRRLGVHNASAKRLSAFYVEFAVDTRPDSTSTGG